MKTPTGKLRQSQNIPTQKGDVLRNVYVHPNNIGLDLHQKQPHFSLDINPSAQIKSHNQYNFFAKQNDNAEVGPRSKETKKRRWNEIEMNKGGSCLGVDLELKLSPPGFTNGNLDGTSEDKLPSLVVMGCTHCYMYMMISEADPKCLICKSPTLLNKFQMNPAKKLRKGLCNVFN